MDLFPISGRQYLPALMIFHLLIQRVCKNIDKQDHQCCCCLIEILKKNGIRCDSDLRNEKITYKIREHSIQKVPYLIVIGDREVEKRHVTVRTQKGEDLGSMSIDDFIKHLSRDIKSKA